MKSIPTLYERDKSQEKITRKLGKPLTDTINEDARWVFDGEGVATRKWDGTACMFDGTTWFRRLESSDTGWTTIGDGPQDQWHREGIANAVGPDPGTYELLGPKVQGNPEARERHEMQRHGEEIYENVPTDLESLKEWLEPRDIEGIVWHHPDGRMAKIKKKDFALPRKPKKFFA